MLPLREGRVGTEHPVDARSPRSGRLPLIASALERVGTEHPVDARSPRSGRLPLIASALERAGTEHPVDARSPRSGRLPLIASALERAGKRPPAVLHLWARAQAIPGEARLVLHRLPTRCRRHYYLDGVLVCLSKTVLEYQLAK